MSNYPANFGPYRLDELLGRGGMGEVYRAYDTEHRRTVAIKRLAPHLADDPEFQRRFRREAHNVAQLSNPHIVPIHKYGEIDGHLYIDMRFVEGGDLDELLLASGPLPFDRGVRILEQIASALDDAHRSGLVHRDVKPSNVLLDAKVADFCYLADFGITKAASKERSTSLTNTGAVMGSLAYMAPEQFDGAVTEQSDIYALACVFYELVTGHKPYEGEGLPALMHAHMMVPPPRPSTRSPGAALFDDVVATGMAKQTGQRYASAGDLARAARSALETHRSQPTAAPADPAAEECNASTATTDRFPPSALRAAVESWSGPAAGHPEPPRPGPGTPTVSAEYVVPPPAEPERPRSDRDRLLPLAAVAVIVALVVGIWAIAQSATTTGTASGAGPGTGTSTPTSAATPTPEPAAPPPAAGPVLSEAVFTGRTADNGLTLAVGIKDGKAAGYLCDGKDVEAWLEGTVSGTALTLNDRTGAPTVTATVSQRALLGTLKSGGADKVFSADIAVEEAGLYQNKRTVAGITSRIGWIVLPNGDEVGIRTRDGVHVPAPRLDPATLTATDDDGQVLQADRLSGASTVISR